MPFDPDRRKAEEREGRAGEPREVEPPGAAAERDREQGDLFPWEENEPGAGQAEEAGEAGESGESGESGDAETPEGAEAAGPRRAPGLMSREKVLWEWPYPGDWIEEELD